MKSINDDGTFGMGGGFFGGFIAEFGRDIVIFPVWWYTRGTMRLVRLVIFEMRSTASALSLRILFRFLLKPMFGYRDWQSRIISFFVRIVHFFILLLFSSVVIALLWTAILVWLILPPLIVFLILFHSGIV